MGTWGTGILQNDTTADIWVEFKELYNNGFLPQEIRIKLEEDYEPQDDEYYSEIWTGIAYGQWMCGGLEEYTLEKVSESTQLKWLILWAYDEDLLNKRIKEISDFISKIKTPRPDPLKRKKVVVRNSFFKKGDVIGIKLDSEQYVAAIVTSHRDYNDDGENTIVFTDLFFKEKTTLKHILKANIFYLDIGGTSNYFRGYYKAIFYARNMAKQIKKVVPIDKIDISEFLSLGLGIPIGDWNNVSKLLQEQLDFLNRNKSEKPFNVSVAQFLKKNEQLEDKLRDWDRKIFSAKLNHR